MADTRASLLRRLWLNVHLWIGVGLGLLVIPIAISGALLVFHDELDGWFNPQRYAVSGANVLPASAYLAATGTAFGSGMNAAVIRFPEQPGVPVVVSARGRTGDGAPRLLNAYVDPPSGVVLEVVDFRASFFGILHRFHENLTIPQYSGRAIVGWVGVAMLISSLTGIWLWWPRNGAIWRGLAWRRSPSTIMNLHHLLGFWIAIPLAIVSFTGIYLGFPQQARQVLGSISAMAPQGQRPFAGSPLRTTTHTPEQALAAALSAVPGAQPLALFLPTASPRQDGAGAPAWRVQVRNAAGERLTVSVDDRTGRASPAPAALAGDRTAQWIRWIHEGSHSGSVWRVVVFFCGVFPPVFVVTGIIMWLRRRTSRAALAERRTPQISPAE